jgi:hypothetical protein
LATINGHRDTVDALLLWGEQQLINVTRPYGDGPSLMSLATFHGKRAVSQVIRHNDWWMWEEAAPEEVLIDGRGRGEEPVWQRVSSAVSDGAKRLRTQLSNIGKDVVGGTLLSYASLGRSRATTTNGQEENGEELVASMRSLVANDDVDS